MTAPFLRWPGGKARLLPRLRPLLRPALVPGARYVEPFAGGLSVFFDLRPARALLGDLNAELIAAYTCVRDDAESVIAELRDLEWTEAGYYAMRDAGPAEISGVSKARRAARFIAINRLAFNGLQRQNASGQSNAAFGGFDARKLPALEQKIRGCSAQLSRAEFMTGDFDATLARAEPGDLVLADPPYHGTFTGYVGAGFGDADQERLARTLLRLAERGAKILTTNADTALVRRLYEAPGWHLHEIPVRRNIAGDASTRRAVTELCFASYDAREVSAHEVPQENMTGDNSMTEPVIVQAARQNTQGIKREAREEVQRRVEFTQELLRSGMDRGAIVRALGDRFGVRTRAADGYIAKAREAFAIDAVAPESLGEARARERDSFLAKLDADVAECKSAGVWNALVGLRRLQADVAGLRQLRPAEPPQAPGPVTNNLIVNLTEPERAHRLALLERILERQKRSAISTEGEASEEPDSAGE